MSKELVQRPQRYQYKGIWIDISIEVDWESNRIHYFASVELPNNRGVLSTHEKESREEAEFAAEELINTWN